MIYSIFSKTPVEPKIKALFNGIMDENHPEVVFSIGGDGTFLKSVKRYEHIIDKVTFVGINTGKLGFYPEFLIDEINVAFEILANNPRYIEYCLLECEVVTEEGKFTELALNEIVITNPMHTQIIDVYIDDEYFETFRGTGFLVSTPSGSTAYNKSLGGCIIDHGIEGMQLTEIAPINNRIYNTLNSSYFLNKNSKISLRINNNDYTFVCVDGIDNNKKSIKEINITISKQKVRVLSKGISYKSRVKKAFLDK